MIDFRHKEESLIGRLLDNNNYEFTYKQPTMVYCRYGRDIIKPSFTLNSYYNDLIIDYIPNTILHDLEHKKELYKNNNLEAIVFNKNCLQQNWQYNLLEKIERYRV